MFEALFLFEIFRVIPNSAKSFFLIHNRPHLFFVQFSRKKVMQNNSPTKPDEFFDIPRKFTPLMQVEKNAKALDEGMKKEAIKFTSRLIKGVSQSCLYALVAYTLVWFFAAILHQHAAILTVFLGFASAPILLHLDFKFPNLDRYMAAYQGVFAVILILAITDANNLPIIVALFSFLAGYGLGSFVTQLIHPAMIKEA